MDTRVTAARIEHDYTLTGPDITDLLIALEQRIERLEDEILDIRCCSPGSINAMDALNVKAIRMRKLAKMFERGFETVNRAKVSGSGFETVIKDAGQ